MSALEVLSPSARRTLLDVLARMSAADGEVSTEEREAYLGACAALALPESPSRELEALPLAALTAREARLVYCAAAWMALADAIRRQSESRSLEQLRDLLGITPEMARLLDAHARWVRTSTDRSWRREADLLLTELDRRLDKLRARGVAA